MKDKKFQVFVSSTYADLKEERQAAVEAILSSGNIPAGMELFSAGDESQMSVIKRWIDESDVYLLILGGRYGSIDSKSNKSYTHLEYEYAIEKNKPLFAVVITEKALEARVKLHGSLVIEQDNPKELKSFRSEVLKNLVKFWDDKKDIKIAIHETISDFSYRKELAGWIRGDNSVNAGILAEEIARLTKENAKLSEEIESLSQKAKVQSNGLSYNELKELLSSKIVKYKNQDMTLFDYIVLLAPSLAIGIYQHDSNEMTILSKLVLYKLVEKIDYNFFKFTNEGHEFYLKTLVK